MRALAALLLALVVACSSAPAPTRCTPGASVACVCPGVGTGAQVCAADGASYGACACVVDAGGGTEDRPAAMDVVAVDRPDGRAGADVVDASLPTDVDPRCVATGAASTWCPSGAGACVDLQRDPANCGACGRRCSAPFTECFGGSCFLPENPDAGVDAGVADVRVDSGIVEFLPDGGCPTSFGNCDGNAANGCEVDLRSGVREVHGGGLGYSFMSCGGCNRLCNSSGAASISCNNGACSITCDRGYYNCNGDPSDGCESTLTDRDNCGMCGNRCPNGQRCSGFPNRCIQ